MSEDTVMATRDWSVEALVRVVAGHASAAVSPPDSRRFRVGDELVMFQWGVAGRPVHRAWWTDFDIDGAFIVPAAKVEVVRIVRAACPFCPHLVGWHDGSGCRTEEVSGRSATWTPVRCECTEPWGGLPAPADAAEQRERARMVDWR